MKSELFNKDTGNTLGIISFTIPLITFLFVLNWFFNITPFQKLEGLPLLMAPFIGLTGLCVGLESLKKLPNRFAKLGVFGNFSLIVLPILYIFLGTLIWGP